ncbi:hypothetical protein LCGC14_1600490 [marine sediment metagenome]|uniref:Uncharacterized protein n=1 Tax=marine sediment metagenome TaxID=412755 RepID=A0A0F9LBC0_9ZZZZ
MCECYRIGGPWIAEDPSCPVHGTLSEGREERIEAIIDRVVDGELTASEASDLIVEEWY